MRVALIAPFGLRPKGTTTARVLPIARVLASQGAEVRVIIPPWDDRERAGARFAEGSGDRGQKTEKRAGVDAPSPDPRPLTPTIVHTRLGPLPVTPAVILWDMLRELRAFGPDVVHAFKPIGYSGAIARRLAAGGLGGPLVVVDTDDLEGPAGWAGRRRLGLDGLLRGAQERRTLRAAHGVTVASGWLADFVVELGVPTERILRLPNGHDVVPGRRSQAPGRWTKEPTADSGLGTRDLRLLWYTRFTEASVGRAAALLGPLLRARPALRLTVLGDELGAGDRGSVERALAAEGVGQQVEWLDYDQGLSENGLGGIAASAVAIYPLDDDLVNRARCPSKIPQLMALGIPLVAEAVGEALRYLEGFETECLVTAADAEGFRARVGALLDDAEKRRRLGNQLSAAAEGWHWDRIAGDLRQWYGEVGAGRWRPEASVSAQAPRIDD